MSRIVAGIYGGRRIATPTGDDTRPTSDRVREALFSALDSANAIYGRRFLDLYAGSGAIGLEAASRGASHVLLVESDPKAARVIRENIALLRAGRVATIAAGQGRHDPRRRPDRRRLRRRLRRPAVRDRRRTS